VYAKTTITLHEAWKSASPWLFTLIHDLATTASNYYGKMICCDMSMNY